VRAAGLDVPAPVGGCGRVTVGATGDWWSSHAGAFGGCLPRRSRQHEGNTSWRWPRSVRGLRPMGQAWRVAARKIVSLAIRAADRRQSRVCLPGEFPKWSRGFDEGASR
jgi:hypothetical protein